MINVDRSRSHDEAVELEATEQFGIVSGGVLRNVENLPLDVTELAAMVNSDGAAVAGNNTDAVDRQPAVVDRTSVVGVAALTVSSVASDCVSADRRISNAVPAMQSSVASFNPSTSQKPRLLPPTAFLSRADGTPIIDTEADHGQTSAFGKPEKSWETEQVLSNIRVPCDSKTTDLAADSAGECSGQLENDCDRMTDLLHVRKTLRTFADNKNKLKYVASFLQLLMP